MFALGMSILAAADRPLQAPSDLVIDLTKPRPAVRTVQLESAYAKRPDGATWSADSMGLILDGKRWLPTSGEFHYARYPESEWRRELLKMKTGGIDVVATYVFWIHHEETKGEWNWSERRNLRKFVQLCGEVGLRVMLRGGPWAHGECRNGGFPDWLQHGYKTRTNDAAYLEQVRRFYGEIGAQIQDLTWAHGGPIIGFQVENEFGGDGDHLVRLKEIARVAGIQVPIYVRTGWPGLRTPTPVDALLPLYGEYPVGFWDRGFAENSDRYATAFEIGPIKTAENILQAIGTGPSAASDRVTYPPLCCEMGGGMQVSYHRRVIVPPDDITSLALVKLASGNNLQGFYMYHGGTNPEGKSTLNETQATNYWNDVPVKSYDFQAPLGEAGQVRPHYHLLRRQALFLRDYGSELAGMWPIFPNPKSSESNGEESLRWSVRTDGQAGFLFVNNYQRMRRLPTHRRTQFTLQTSGGVVNVPSSPIDIPSNRYFMWPIMQDLEGVRLRYATVQPVCRLQRGDEADFFYAEIPGIAPEFSFRRGDLRDASLAGIPDGKETVVYRGLRTGLRPALSFTTRSGKRVNVFLLSELQSLRLYKAQLGGCDRVLLSADPAFFDHDRVTFQSEGHLSSSFAVYPPIAEVGSANGPVRARAWGTFAEFDLGTVTTTPESVQAIPIEREGRPKENALGSQGVAEQPSDTDFEHAISWRLKLPTSWEPGSDAILRVRYTGDVARLYLDGKLIADDFFNGKPMDVAIDRYLSESGKGELVLKVLPLDPNAPIYFAPGMRPEFGDRPSAGKLYGVELVHRPQRTVTVH